MKLTTTTFVAVLAAGAILACGSARADDSTNAAPPLKHKHMMMRGHGHAMKHLDKALKLTDEQKPQVQPILESEHRKIHEVFEKMRSHDISRKEGIAKIKAIRRETARNLKSILTPEQFKKWKKMTQPRHEMKHHSDNNAPPAAGQ